MLGFNASLKKNLIIGSAVLVISQLGRIIDMFKKFTGATQEAKKEMQSFNDLIDGADNNEGFVDALEEAFVIVHDFEHELSHRIPTATEKAIQKFREMNDGVLEDIKKKKENIRMIIAEGINSGITKMSEALSRSLVFGEKLSDTFRNMALNVLGKIISALIEQIARQAISIAMENTQIGQLMTKLGIEKMITHEKTKQSVMKGVSTGGDLLTGIMGSFASGGAVSKGQPILVGENGAEVFVPNQTGQITQSARGGSGGGSTTVNFNINTVDARGFDELLTQSRGTITQLINQAVNERGAKSII
jgi:translation elongation factor EF-G